MQKVSFFVKWYKDDLEVMGRPPMVTEFRIATAQSSGFHTLLKALQQLLDAVNPLLFPLTFCKYLARVKLVC